jgi:spore photoproduct lyase
MLGERVVRVYGGGIIRKFMKTPPFIVCPHFYELNWAYGCPFDCAYCYLKGTFRGRTEPRYVSLKYVFQALDEAFNDNSNHDFLKPTVFNAGELADSLAELHDSRKELKCNPPRIVQIADWFEERGKHKLLLLTKSHMIEPIVERGRKHTIISFSINAREAWRRWEHRTPPPEKRIEAAERAFYAGYEVRIRIDPIFPVENWKEEYGNLINLILSKVYPERITLGTPRGLKSTLKYSKDSSWKKFLCEMSAWGKKLPYKSRAELYAFMIDKLLEQGYAKSKIALCKERRDVWFEVGLDPGKPPKSRYASGWEECRCNCVL